MLTRQLELLIKEFSTLKEKIKTKLSTLTETTTKLNESNHKLELSLKENSENEEVLKTLLKEFKELGEELDK
jgi:septal ring factor EnvC (AmiA/AmiB activator)